MIQAEKATFSFDGFKINRSLFEFSNAAINKLNIGINASGKHFLKSNIFHLILKVQIQIPPDNYKIIEIEAESIFSFSGVELDNLMNYFIINAPAITFPYIRSYVSTLSIQSGTIPILLPTMNLLSLADQLKNSIEIINE